MVDDELAIKGRALARLCTARCWELASAVYFPDAQERVPRLVAELSSSLAALAALYAGDKRKKPKKS